MKESVARFCRRYASMTESNARVLTLRYFRFADFDVAFFRFSSTLNLTILLINWSGNGLSIGNLTEPLAPS